MTLTGCTPFCMIDSSLCLFSLLSPAEELSILQGKAPLCL